jgi:hypothetical protein
MNSTMNRAKPSMEVAGALILGASLPGLQGQAPSPAIEQELRFRYHRTRVGNNVVVVGRSGSVLLMQDTE